MSVTRLVERAPLVAFFVLAFATYVFGPLLLLVHETIFPIYDSRALLLTTITLGSWFPNLAALVVTGVLSGRAGVIRLFGGFLRWRVLPGCYLIAPLPIVLVGFSAAIYSGSGLPSGTCTLTLRSLLTVTLLSVIAGASGEKVGWRGFALIVVISTKGRLGYRPDANPSVLWPPPRGPL